MVVLLDGRLLQGQRATAETTAQRGTTAPSASELREAHRLETLGRLTPGMAHELSTPAQFMGDTVSFLNSVLEGYAKVLAAYEELAREADGVLPEAVRKVRAAEKDVNLRYLNQRAPGALSRMESGVRRIADTARALSALSEPALTEGDVADLQLCLDRALMLLSASIRHVTVVKVSLAAPIVVRMMPRDLSDVVLNVLANAVEAVTAAGHRAKTGLVEIQGEAREDAVVVDVADNGVGIDSSQLSRLFEPGFGTKGRRGRGLSIARDVARSYGGTISCLPVSAGAHFRLILPAAKAKGAA